MFHIFICVDYNFYLQESISALSFDKKEIRGILEKNGGCVLKEFPGTKQKIPEEIILISDKQVSF